MSPSRWRLRRVFRKPISAIAVPLAHRGIRPNTITYVSLLVGLSALLALVVGRSPFLFGLLVFVTGLLDGVDGAVARLNSSASSLGAFTDSSVDKVTELLLLLAIGLAFPSEEFLGLTVPLWVVLCAFSWLLTSYTRSRAEVLGARDLDIGLGGRSERLFLLFIVSLAGAVLWALVIGTLLGIATASYRFYHYGRQIAEIDAHSEQSSRS